VGEVGHWSVCLLNALLAFGPRLAPLPPAPLSLSLSPRPPPAQLDQLDQRTHLITATREATSAAVGKVRQATDRAMESEGVQRSLASLSSGFQTARWGGDALGRDGAGAGRAGAGGDREGAEETTPGWGAGDGLLSEGD
jgi:hypothetical protein